ncbi:MAG: glycosyltransferase family 4 protein [Desulfobacterales bacterium]|nr:glycosyltransferase family 4 protein [Desulfobacterales bacterium]
MKEKLESLCRRNRKTNIRLAGFIDYKALPLLYQEADVLILPSLEDNWGFVINEAMASGVPVLCSTYAQAREMVIEGENGYIFDPLNEQETLSAIITMYEKRDQWPQLGRKGRETVEQYFSPQKSVTKMVAGVRKILDR